MIEPIQKYMQVGLIHFMAYPSTMRGEGPIEETVRKICVDDYFEAIEITWIKDPEVRARVKQMLDSSHMTVAYGGQPRILTTGSNVNDLDESKRQTIMQSMKEGIDEAYEMGAVGYGFLSGKYEEATKEESYKQLIKSITEMCEYAQSKGDMRVALEVFDYDIAKCSLVGPVEMAKRVCEEICPKYKNFGLMVDLSHIPMIHESNWENLVPIREYIIHAHMGNTVIDDPAHEAYGDEHPRFGFPNSENDVDELVAYLRMLMAVGYLTPERRPILSFEVKPLPYEDPDIVVANAKRTLNLAWAKV